MTGSNERVVTATKTRPNILFLFSPWDSRCLLVTLIVYSTRCVLSYWVLCRVGDAFFICFHFFLNNGVLVSSISIIHICIRWKIEGKKAVEEKNRDESQRINNHMTVNQRDSGKKEPDLNGSNLENCKSSDKKTTNYILNKVLFLCAVYDWQQCQCQRRTAPLDVSLLVRTRTQWLLASYKERYNHFQDLNNEWNYWVSKRNKNGNKNINIK